MPHNWTALNYKHVKKGRMPGYVILSFPFWHVCKWLNRMNFLVDSRNLSPIKHDLAWPYMHFEGPRSGQLVADGDCACHHVNLRGPREQPATAQGCHRSAAARIRRWASERAGRWRKKFLALNLAQEATKNFPLLINLSSTRTFLWGSYG